MKVLKSWLTFWEELNESFQIASLISNVHRMYCSEGNSPIPNQVPRKANIRLRQKRRNELAKESYPGGRWSSSSFHQDSHFSTRAKRKQKIFVQTERRTWICSPEFSVWLYKTLILMNGCLHKLRGPEQGEHRHLHKLTPSAGSALRLETYFGWKWILCYDLITVINYLIHQTIINVEGFFAFFPC